MGGPVPIRALRNAALMEGVRQASRATSKYLFTKKASRQQKNSNEYNNSYSSRANTRRQLSDYSSKAICKRHSADFAASTRASNTVTALCLTQIVQSSSLSARERQVIYVKGVKLNMFLRNNTNKPQFVNWAVLQMKHFVGTPDSLDIGKDMFHGTTDSRAVNFTNVVSAWHKHTYDLNTDKYIVHAEGRFVLSADDSTQVQSGAISSFKKLERWVPINRKVFYEGAATGDSSNAIMFCYWTNPWDETTSTPILNQVESNFHSTLYFQDPK